MNDKIDNKVNPDLVTERKKCTFNTEELAIWWHGGREMLLKKRKLDTLFFNDPKLTDDTPSIYLSMKDRHEYSLRKFTLIEKKIRQFEEENGIDNKDFDTKYNERGAILGAVVGSDILRDGSPLSVHGSMFIYTLANLTSEAQKKEWLEKAWNYNNVGTYAQTELGHGTFLRGLETTSTYDEKTQEFVINSPTLSSYKWWPGGLGHNTNYAIVVAQLYTKGKCYGVHQFIVPTRDSETWKPLPGIEIGEIGARLGIHNFNNGYLKMENIRVPRTNMLLRAAEVLPDGTYVKRQEPVLTYFTMLFIRATIVKHMSSCLAKAATIAIRYSAVRHQSPIQPDQSEPQIIDHVTQQYKLLPNLATGVVFKILFDYIWDLFSQVRLELQKSDYTRLPELHAILSSFKCYTTAAALSSMETLRLSCGGHGYMDSANFTTLYAAVAGAYTYEGEYTVLALQAARFLIKSWGIAIAGGKLEPTVAYLSKSQINNRKWNSSLPGIAESFEIVAAQKIRIAYEDIENYKKTGHTVEEARNFTGIKLVQANEAHCKALLVRILNEMLVKLVKQLSPKLFVTVQQLVELYIIDLGIKSVQDLLRFTNLDEMAIQALQTRLEKLLTLIRPNAIGFVDGFDYHDVMLGSTLGSYDGNVYERLYNEAQKSPLNREGMQDAFEKYLKPLMKSQL